MSEEPKSVPMRISVEAITQARIASGIRGVSMVQYMSQVILEAAARDIEEFRRGGAPPARKPRRSKDN
jgi:hypothetical protein